MSPETADHFTTLIAERKIDAAGAIDGDELVRRRAALDATIDEAFWAIEAETGVVTLDDLRALGVDEADALAVTARNIAARAGQQDTASTPNSAA